MIFRHSLLVAYVIVPWRVYDVYAIIVQKQVQDAYVDTKSLGKKTFSKSRVCLENP